MCHYLLNDYHVGFALGNCKISNLSSDLVNFVENLEAMGRKKKELPLLEGINIVDVAAEGKAIAKIERPDRPGQQMVIFIPYGAPGDVADVKIDRKKHSFAEGHIEKLIKPSDIRVEPRCRHFGICGGCKWQHLPYDAQLSLKRQQVVDALERIGKVKYPEVKPVLGSKKQWGYRNKMEYTASDKRWRTWEEMKNSSPEDTVAPALGFHIPGAFDKVLHIEECLLQEDTGNKIRRAIYDFAIENGLTFFNIRANQGLLRTAMIRTASTGEVMVCVVFGENDPGGIKAVMGMLEEKFPEIDSLLYVVNLKLNDSITDQKVEVWKGPDYIEEEMEGLRFRVNAKSFYQTNSGQAYELYKVARRFAGLEKRGENAPLVYDLYTGTGTIANFVARNSRKVIGIEYVPEAIEDAKLNSKVNGIDNTLFFAGDMKNVLTDSFIEEHGRPEVMIVDPPRAGMHEDVVKTILRTLPDVLVYVSCNPATQARDLALLDAAYEITDVQPVDMFPHTHHVENVVRLQLRPQDSR